VQREGEREDGADRGVDKARRLADRLAREDLDEVAREDERQADPEEGEPGPASGALAAANLRQDVGPP